MTPFSLDITTTVLLASYNYFQLVSLAHFLTVTLA